MATCLLIILRTFELLLATDHVVLGANVTRLSVTTLLPPKGGL